MTVARLMKTHVLTLPSTANLDTAAACMEEAGIRHLPIADAQGRLIGVVSQRDVSRARDVVRTAEGRRQQLRLGDIMREALLGIEPSLRAGA